MLLTLKWVFAGLFGYAIAWWFWALIGLAGAVAVFLLLPALTPLRMRAALAGLVFMIGACISAGSWGMDQGIHLERLTWEAKLETEKQRLRDEASANLINEQARAGRAEATSADLRRQLNELMREAPGDSDSTIVVPESVTRKLYDLRGNRP